MTTLQFDMSGLLDRTLSKVNSGSMDKRDKGMTRTKSTDNIVNENEVEDITAEVKKQKQLKRSKSNGALRVVVSALKRALSDNGKPEEEKQTKAAAEPASYALAKISGFPSVNSESIEQHFSGVEFEIEEKGTYDSSTIIKDIIPQLATNNRLLTDGSTSASDYSDSSKQLSPVQFGTFNFLENRWVTTTERSNSGDVVQELPFEGQTIDKEEAVRVESQPQAKPYSSKSASMQEQPQSHLVKMKFATFNFLENRWVRAEEREIDLTKAHQQKTDETEDEVEENTEALESNESSRQTEQSQQVQNVQPAKLKKLRFVTFNFLENRWVKPNERNLDANQDFKLTQQPSSKLVKFQEFKDEIVDNIRKLPTQEFLTFNFLQNKWVKKPRSFTGDDATDYDIKQITDSEESSPQKVKVCEDENAALLNAQTDSGFDEEAEMDFIVVDQELLLAVQDEEAVYCFRWGGLRRRK
eukprot:TRINITY_DN722_c0_g1_i1.p1 TRINITY_DN722_c0_g1~~TRINITY_DN722_c0_g1_i1.p1  ORF type:complete len:469 (+),score=68.01 TRINITY_DN722_c0_g1_i1:118-1524(+)